MEIVWVERGRIDLDAGTLETSDGQTVRMTPTETRLLAYLVAHENCAVDPKVLLSRVWDCSPRNATQTVPTTIRRLRRKIERSASHPRHILTIHTGGYLFRPLDGGAIPPDAASPEPDLFVGRRDELGALRTELRCPEGFVSLVGIGGIGKTRLASEIAARLAPELPGGVHFCDLTRARTDADIVREIARAANLPLAGDVPARQMARLGRALHAMGPALLVLDNAEGARVSLGALLEAWARPRPGVLVTSRVPLSVPGERVLSVEPLPGEAAGELFAVRVAAARGDSALSDSDTERVAAIVARLDGIPLAIELASRWSRVLSLEQLGERLARRSLPLLAGTDEARPARHQTLQAALWSSWELLSDDERAALAACAIFRGSFDEDAASDVLSAIVAAPLDVVDVLIGRGLLRASPSGVRRMSMLDTVRSFARERLDEMSARREAVSDAHLRHYARRISPERIRLFDREPDVARAVFLPDHDDIRVVAEQGRGEDVVQAAIALSLLDTLDASTFRTLFERLQHRADLSLDSRARIAQYLSRYQLATGDPGAALRTIEALGEAVAELSAYRRLEHERSLGVLLCRCRSLAAGAPHLDRALELARSEGRLQEGRMLCERASYMAERREARAMLRDAVQLLASEDAPLDEAAARCNLALLCGPEEAVEHLERALDISRRSGRGERAVAPLINLGLVHLNAGRLERARPCFEEAMEISIGCGRLDLQAASHMIFGTLSLSADDVASARIHLDAAEDLCEELGTKYLLTKVMVVQTRLLLAEGALGAAEARFDALMSLLDQLGADKSEPVLLALRGTLLAERGQRDAARSILDELRARYGAPDERHRLEVDEVRILERALET